MYFDLIVIGLLLLLNAFFAMAELAIVSARRARLKQMAEQRVKGARLAMQLAEDPTSFLSIVQIGVTLNSILAGAFSGATLAKSFGTYLDSFPMIAPYGQSLGLGLTVAAVTYFSLVVGELLPKRIGLSYAETIAVRVAYAMQFFARVAAPLVWVLRLSTDVLLRLLRLDKPNDKSITEDEVKDLIAEGAQSGVFKEAEKDMLEGVMRLADRTVRTLMTPRIDMVWLNLDQPPEVNARVIRENGYSRFPVARGDMHEVSGFVHAKDILNTMFEGSKVDLAAIMRVPLTVPDTTPVLRLLEQFKQTGEHIAIVIDEYGSVEGLVTSSDILSTITGGFEDGGEDDYYKPVRREDGSWLLDGMMPVDEVETIIGLKNMSDEGDFHTIAGFMIGKFGRIPAPGDHFEWNEARFEVMDMDGRRVDKVLINPPPVAQSEVDSGT